MQKDPREMGWGMRLNRRPWSSAKDWPAWISHHQREKWNEAGLILWDEKAQQIARFSGTQSLAMLDELRENTEWHQCGCVVGEPVWRLLIDEIGREAEPVLTNKIALTPEQAQVLCDFLLRVEQTLRQMKAEEEEEKANIWTQICAFLLEAAEQGKHSVYDGDLSWEENKRIMRTRWESGALPEQLTRTERRLFADVLTEINAEHQREEMNRRERVRNIKKNLLNYHFFWGRTKTLWPYLKASERLHILQQLQDLQWDERIVAEIKQVIENAEFFDAVAQKAGALHEPDRLTGEELDLLLDLPDEELWKELLDLYRHKPHAAAGNWYNADYHS
jgi:hypothetical protein